MNTQRDKIRAMLSEYLDGELPQPQAEEVSAALAQDAELAREYADLLATRNAVSALRNTPAPQDMAERIMHATHHRIFSEYQIPQRKNPFGKLFHAQMLAAAAVVLVAVGMGLYVINALSRTQQSAGPIVAINAKEHKISAKDIATSDRMELADARPATPDETAASPKPLNVDGMSTARRAAPAARETIARLEEKIRDDGPDFSAETPDLKPVIAPEPSLAMNDYKSKEDYDSVWRDDAERSKGTDEGTPAPVTAPPVLKAPKTISSETASETRDITRTRGLGYFHGNAPVIASAPKPADMSDVEKQDKTLSEVNELEKLEKPKELAKKRMPVEVAKAEYPASPTDLRYAATEKPAAAKDKSAKSAETVECIAAEPSEPCAPRVPEVAVIEAPAAFESRTAKPEKEEIPAGAPMPVKPADKPLFAAGSTVAATPQPAAQNIIIETPNVGEAQTKLDSYFKSNNIAVVSTRQSPTVDAVRARRAELNRNIQLLDTWADKEPVRLEYSIRTNESQAQQINADLARQFPAAQNLRQDVIKTRLADRSEYGYAKKTAPVVGTKVLTNATDANPVIMVITIQRRTPAAEARPIYGTGACTTRATTLPTSAPASQPATQPTTQPTAIPVK